MNETAYRTGQVARMLSASPYHIRRLCEAGMVEAELTDGRRWRIPSREVERLKRDGLPPIPQVERTADRVKARVDDHAPDELAEAVSQDSISNRSTGPNQAEAVFHGSPEVREAVDSVAIAEAQLKRRRIELEQTNVEDEFEARDRRRMTAQQEERRRQQEAETEKARRAAVDSWLAYAFRQIPPDYPAEARLSVSRAVEAVLVAIPPEYSKTVITQMVDAAIAEGLKPARRSKEIQRAIEAAVNTLPRGAKGGWSPTDWQTTAAAAAERAVTKLGDTVGYAEMLVAARAAARLLVVRNHQAFRFRYSVGMSLPRMVVE